MLRLLSFALFIATWWIASLVIGDAKLPAPPAVLSVLIAEARSGALFVNLGATLARVALAFTLAMALDSGRFDLNSMWDARGPLHYGKFAIHEDRKSVV